MSVLNTWPTAWLRPRKGQSTSSEGDSTGGRGGAANLGRVWAGQADDPRLTEQNPDLFGTKKYRTFQTIRRVVPAPVAYWALVKALGSKARFDIDAPEERINAVLHHSGLRTSWAQTKSDMIEALLTGYSLCEWVTERFNGVYRIASIRKIPQSSIFEFRLGPDQEVEYFVQYGTQLRLIRRWQTLYTVVGPGIEGEGTLLSVGDRSLKWINHDIDVQAALSANLRDVPDVTAPNDAMEKDTPIVRGLRSLIQMKDKIRHPRTLLPSNVFKGDSSGGGVTFAASAPQFAAIQHKPVPIGDNDRLMMMNREIALSLNAEALLLGADGAGSLALADTQTNLLYDSVDGTLNRMADEIARMLRVIWRFNGWGDEVNVSVDNSARLDPAKLAGLLSTIANVPRDLYADAIDDVMERGGLTLQGKGQAE